MENEQRLTLYKQSKKKMETLSRLVSEYQRVYNNLAGSLDDIAADKREIEKLKNTVLPPLYRIMRERANKERNLRPKKEHCGFYVKRITQEPGRLGAVTWRAIVQTPYSERMAPSDVHTLWQLFGESQCQEGLGLTETDIKRNKQKARLDLQPTIDHTAYWNIILSLSECPKKFY